MREIGAGGQAPQGGRHAVLQVRQRRVGFSAGNGPFEGRFPGRLDPPPGPRPPPPRLSTPSLQPDGSKDFNSLHGSCPVLAGSKWSASRAGVRVGRDGGGAPHGPGRGRACPRPPTSPWTPFAGDQVDPRQPVWRGRHAGPGSLARAGEGGAAGVPGRGGAVGGGAWLRRWRAPRPRPRTPSEILPGGRVPIWTPRVPSGRPAGSARRTK